MHGRSCSCLLVVCVLIFAPRILPGQSSPGQSSRVDSAPDFTVPLRTGPPNVAQPDVAQPDVAQPDVTQPSPREQLRPHLPIHPPGAPVHNPPPGFGFLLLARTAGTIFSGTVTAIRRHPINQGEAVETVAITFRVDNAIRGATRGEDLTVLQWIGLWSSGQRYRVGERVLLFLYPPSKLGLTSCVAGALGRFTIDPRGQALLSAQHLSAFQSDPVLGGKSRASFSDFALAVRQAGEEE
jgi:hypothetical protein